MYLFCRFAYTYLLLGYLSGSPAYSFIITDRTMGHVAPTLTKQKSVYGRVAPLSHNQRDNIAPIATPSRAPPSALLLLLFCCLDPPLEDLATGAV